MPYAVIKRKSYSNRHVVEGLCWAEVRQLANRTGWMDVDVICNTKVVFKGDLRSHSTTDLLNALEEMGYKLISVAGFSNDDANESNCRVVGWTMHRPIAGANNRASSPNPNSCPLCPQQQSSSSSSTSAAAAAASAASQERAPPPSYEDALAAMTPSELQAQRRELLERRSLPTSPLATTPTDSYYHVPHHRHSSYTSHPRSPVRRRLMAEADTGTPRRGSMPALYAPSAPPALLRPPPFSTGRRSTPTSPYGSTEFLEDPWAMRVPQTAPSSPGYQDEPEPLPEETSSAEAVTEPEEPAETELADETQEDEDEPAAEEAAEEEAEEAAGEEAEEAAEEEAEDVAEDVAEEEAEAADDEGVDV